MSLATDIGGLLAGAGLVTVSPTANFTYFERWMPDGEDHPDEVTVFFESPAGRDADWTQDVTKKVLFPRFQIRCRGAVNADDTAEARMKAIHNFLDGKRETTLATGRAILIAAVGYYGFLGRDDLGRASFVDNFELHLAGA